MKKQISKLKPNGFSLIELMIVVAIIGILASVAIPNFKSFQRKARQSEAKALLGSIYTGESSYKTEFENYSTCVQGIGFRADGTIRYNAGFHVAFNGGYAGIPCNLNLSELHAYDVANPPPGVVPFNVAYVLPAINAAGTATQTNFNAFAFANTAAGFASNDEWRINEFRDLVNTASGL